MGKIKLTELLNHDDPLYRLANIIDWNFLEEAVGKQLVTGKGRPALSSRLVIGLHYLKYLENKSDEQAVDNFVRNPYWQYFCGSEYFEHEYPLNPSSLSRWRSKVGLKKLEKLLEETLNSAKKESLLKTKDMKQVNVDTTVQEKNITFPTDSKLMHKMRKKLVKASKIRGIKLRQTYERVGKTAFIKQARYSHARQLKRAKKERKKLKNYLGRILRDIERKVDNPDKALKELIDLGYKIFNRKKDDKNKIYSLHEKEVECISKGKAHKKYEFGCKVSIVSTVQSNWIVGAQALHGNPYDGHTLKSSIDQAQKLSGQRPKKVNVDKGYKGKKNHPEDVDVLVSGTKAKSRSIRRFMKKRSAIEPIIGHLKSDHRMSRNFLKGKLGDKVNCILSACAFNLKKIMNLLVLQNITI